MRLSPVTGSLPCTRSCPRCALAPLACLCPSSPLFLTPASCLRDFSNLTVDRKLPALILFFCPGSECSVRSTGREEAEGGVAAVVTEDSDLMVYGCRRVVYKLDSHGNGMEFELEWALGPPPERLMPEVARGAVLSFRGFCMDMLRTVCVLAGCDFLPSVRGMGFKRAHSLVKRFKTLDRVRLGLSSHRQGCPRTA